MPDISLGAVSDGDLLALVESRRPLDARCASVPIVEPTRPTNKLAHSAGRGCDAGSRDPQSMC